MYKLLAISACMAFLSVSSAEAQQWVNGYTKKNGTYVQGHYRSTRDGNPFNNYSTRGNRNPYTGQTGSVNPYRNNNTFGNYGSYGTRTKPSGGLYGRRY